MSLAWRRHRVPLSWGRLSVNVAGDGPPLLLIHGLGGSGRYWAGLAPYLAGRRTLIAPDLAGFGRSDKPRLDYSRDFHLANLDGLLHGLHVDGPVAVAGHSMGGVLAALFAAHRPERTGALVLAAVPFPRVQLHPYRVPRGVVGRAVYGSLQRVLPLASPLVRSKTFPRAVIADYMRHTVDSYQRTSESLIWDPAVVDELAPLRSLDLPELLLFSRDDRTIAPDSLDRWRVQVPRAQVTMVPGAHQLLLRGGFAVLAQWLLGHSSQVMRA